MTYFEQIQALVGGPIHIHKLNIESYMSKTPEEGKWVIVNVAPGLTSTERLVAQWTLVAMPGCCGIVISTACKTYERYQHRGLGTLLNQMRIQMAYELGYSLILSTDVTTNVPQERILQKMQWRKLTVFKNRRTDNAVSLNDHYTMNTGVDLGFNMKGR
jgi:hypothetical protein